MLSGAWKKLHQPRVYLTVEPVLFLFSFASFLSYTVFQELLHHLICQRTSNCSSPATHHYHEEERLWDDDGGSARCAVPGPTEQRVQTDTSHWLLYVNVASGVPAVLVSVFYGAVSDVKGRRPFMVLPALGSIVNQAVVLSVVHLSHTLPLPFLLLGSFVSGLCGTFPVFNFAVYSYVSDVSTTSKRTVQIGVLESMTFLGATLSLVVGGRWVDNIHFTGPLICIIVIDLVIVAYVVVALPESLDVIRRQQEVVGGASIPNSSPRQPYHLPSGQHVQQQDQPSDDGISRTPCTCNLLGASIFKLSSFLKLLFRNYRLAILLGIFFVVEINFLGINDTVILYALGRPLCWGTELIGYFLAAKVFLNGVATLLLLPLLSLLLKFTDVWLMAAGLVSGCAGLLLMGSSAHTWMMFTGRQTDRPLLFSFALPFFTLSCTVCGWPVQLRTFSPFS